MKTYEQDAREILQRGSAARKKIKRTRIAVCSVLAGVLVFAAAFGILRHPFPAGTDVTTAPGEGTTAFSDGTTLPPETSIPAETSAVPAESTTAPPEGAPMQPAQPGEPTDVPETTTVLAECYLMPAWEERGNADRYTDLSFGGVQYRVAGAPWEAALTGAPVGTGEATGYDYRKDERHSLSVSVYAVPGMDPSVAVYALVENDTVAYQNVRFSSPTLGDLTEKLDLHNSAEFGSAFWTYYDGENKATHYFTSEDFDDALVWEMLLDDGSVPCSSGEGVTLEGQTMITVYISIFSLGIPGKALAVTPEGWIMTNVTETARYFFVGPEKTQAFIAHVKTQIPYEENVISPNPGTAVPAPETPTEPYTVEAFSTGAGPG